MYEIVHHLPLFVALSAIRTRRLIRHCLQQITGQGWGAPDGINQAFLCGGIVAKLGRGIETKVRKQPPDFRKCNGPSGLG
jgi:hypothetical protein